MLARTRFVAAVVVALGLSVHLHAAAKAEVEPRLSGPYTHENLMLFFIHGDDLLNGMDYMVLKEAIEQNRAVVRDNGALTIENLSDVSLYVQSGEIVKGAGQDRCLGTDMTLAPRSGAVSIPAYCVEQHRSTARSGESPTQFNSSGGYVFGNTLKLLGNSNYRDAKQEKVWSEIALQQRKLSENAGAAVQSPDSPSSLQLTLENRDLERACIGYVKVLDEAFKGKEDDITGCVVAINGRIIGGDNYASPKLFKKMWPKLLGSAAVEAVSELRSQKADAPDEQRARKFFISALADVKETRSNDRFNVLTKETEHSLVFECYDPMLRGAWVHRAYFAKDPAAQPDSGVRAK